MFFSSQAILLKKEIDRISNAVDVFYWLCAQFFENKCIR